MPPGPGPVVFDLDGVIVDSEPTHVRANAEWVAAYGTTLDRLLPGSMLGRRVRDLTDAVAPAIGRTPAEAFAEREAVFWRLVRERPLQPMPGLRDAVERLGTAGLPLAVASSGTREYVRHVLDRLGVRDAFTVVVSGDEVANGKPDPEIYLLAATRLATDPTTCIAIEDAPAGIAAARAAGMRTIAIPTPHATPETLTAADAIASDLSTAADLILVDQRE